MWPIPKIAGLIGAIVIPNAVGFLVSMSTREEVKGDWYMNLKKSPLNPPGWVFPIAWTSLYTTMGIASFMIYQSGGGFSGPARLPLGVYAASLVFNGIWNPLFFNAHRPDLSMIDIVVIDGLVAACIATFLPVNKTAALLMVPYMAWVTFASYLNFYIWYYNRKSD
jgi:tryptophan-rich sensory protein